MGGASKFDECTEGIIIDEQGRNIFFKRLTFDEAIICWGQGEKWGI